MEHKYDTILALETQGMVSFASESGDGEWEAYADLHKWMYKENNDCCLPQKEIANFCDQCGAGVNGRDVYVIENFVPEQPSAIDGIEMVLTSLVDGVRDYFAKGGQEI